MDGIQYLLPDYRTFYQAIHPDSELFQRLQVDRKLECVLSNFYDYGSQPFDLLATGPEETESSVDLVRDKSILFRSRAEIEEILAVLLDLIDRAILDAYPGLMDRVVFIEKTLDLIEKRVEKRLNHDSSYTAMTLLGSLFSADSYFTNPRAELGLGFRPLALVTPFKVDNVANILVNRNPKLMFNDDEEEHLREDYQNLRDLYLQVAALGEAILIG